MKINTLLILIILMVTSVMDSQACEKLSQENPERSQPLNTIFDSLVNNYPNLYHNYPKTCDLTISDESRSDESRPKHYHYTFSIRKLPENSSSFNPNNMFSYSPKVEIAIVWFPTEYYLSVLKKLELCYMSNQEDNGYTPPTESYIDINDIPIVSNFINSSTLIDVSSTDIILPDLTQYGINNAAHLVRNVPLAIFKNTNQNFLFCASLIKI